MISKQLQIEKRVVRVAIYIIENNATIRQTARELGICKSTVSNDINRLPDIDYDLYLRVRRVLNINLNERHIRGGQATRNNYISNHNFDQELIKVWKHFVQNGTKLDKS